MLHRWAQCAVAERPELTVAIVCAVNILVTANCAASHVGRRDTVQMLKFYLSVKVSQTAHSSVHSLAGVSI